MTTGRTFVAVDMLGAGVGDLVLITQGSSARMTPETKNMPIDAVIIGIVDQVHVDQRQRVFSREKVTRSCKSTKHSIRSVVAAGAGGSRHAAA